MHVKTKLNRIRLKILNTPEQELISFKVDEKSYIKLQKELGRKHIAHYIDIPVIVVKNQKGITYSTQLKLF